MKIKFEQLYFGHDGTQYRILASSESALNDRMEKYCTSVGTPLSGSQEIPSFLMSIPVDGQIFMICVQKGNNDNQGRPTLFFHGMVCSLTDAETYGINVMALAEGGYFHSSPQTSLDSVNLEFRGNKTEFIPFTLELKPVIFWSDTEQSRLIWELLGTTMVNRVPWSGFSWRRLDNFVVYALSDQAVFPENCSVRKVTGEFITEISEDSPNQSFETELEPESEPEEEKPSEDQRSKDSTFFQNYVFPSILGVILSLIIILWTSYFDAKVHHQTPETQTPKNQKEEPCKTEPTISQENPVESSEKPEQSEQDESTLSMDTPAPEVETPSFPDEIETKEVVQPSEPPKPQNDPAKLRQAQKDETVKQLADYDPSKDNEVGSQLCNLIKQHPDYEEAKKGSWDQNFCEIILLPVQKLLEHINSSEDYLDKRNDKIEACFKSLMDNKCIPASGFPLRQFQNLKDSLVNANIAGIEKSKQAFLASVQKSASLDELFKRINSPEKDFHLSELPPCDGEADRVICNFIVTNCSPGNIEVIIDKVDQQHCNLKLPHFEAFVKDFDVWKTQIRITEINEVKQVGDDYQKDPNSEWMVINELYKPDENLVQIGALSTTKKLYLIKKNDTFIFLFGTNSSNKLEEVNPNSVIASSNSWIIPNEGKWVKIVFKYRDLDDLKLLIENLKK